jgi:NAD(P)-dependent dehydrogenase (short-subunit alcohol dehydrogenase family)
VDEIPGRLAGHVGVITGAGQGIGRGIALAMAKEGASVALAGRTLRKVRDVAGEVTELGGRALALECDVRWREQVDAAMAATVAVFGRIDSLVNNAQSSSQQTLEETTEQHADECWRSGPMGTLYGMQAALPHLRAHGGGSIVNFGSGTAIRGDQTFGAYAMAKEAIRGLSRVAAREWGPYGIRVNVVVPTALSPSAAEYMAANPEIAERINAEIPLGRTGDPERDIGRAVAALVSDDLCYLTGATLMLGGGRTLLG